MKVRVKSTGEIITVMAVLDGFCDIANHRVYPGTDIEIIDFCAPEAIITGWVAVDDFGNAYIYHTKPTQRYWRYCDTGDYIDGLDCVTKYPNGKRCFVIDKDFFPNLTANDSPIEVEIIIKRKKKK